MPKNLARSLFTLASKILTRSPKQNAAIAAAVDIPIPGKVSKISEDAGNCPANFSSITLAQAWRFLALV